MFSKIKIDILISNFNDLGAQRVAVNIANGLANIYDINFVVFKRSGPFENYLDKNIKIVELDKKTLNLPKIKVVGRMIAYFYWQKTRKTDVAVSFSPITNIVVLFAKFFNPKLKTIIQEHAYPSLALKDRENANYFFELFYKYIGFKFYNKSDVFITIAEAIKNDFVENFGIKKEIFRIVRNPVDVDGIYAKSLEKVDDFDFKKEKKYLVGVGRLVDQKNFKRLIDILVAVIKDVPEAELIILGDGHLKADLLVYCKEKKIEAAVHFLGFKSNPYKYIAKSKCFCLSSNWEGLPQVIAEAMICKTLVVANDCPSGPSEMIKKDLSGFLIPLNDINRFKQVIVLVLKDEEKNKKLIENAFNFATQEYSIKKCIGHYQEIIESLVSYK